MQPQSEDGESKRAMAASWLRLACQAGRMGTWDWEPATDRFFWSPELLELCGLTGPAPGGLESWLALVHSEDRAAARDQLRHAGEQGRKLDFHCRVALPDGSIRWLHVLGEPLADRAPADRLLGVCLDRTAQVQLREELRTAQQRLAQLFGRSRDGFVIVDRYGRILDANPAYCEMLGYTLAELRQLPDFYRITPERWHAWEAAEIWERRLLGPGHSGLYEKEYIRRDGTVFPVELQSYAVRDEAGELDYLWGTVRDISERRRAETAHREREERLQTLSDHLPNGLLYQIDSGPDGQARRFSYLSRGVETLHEVSLEAALADANLIYSQLVPEDLARVAQAEQLAAAQHSRLDLEARVRLPSGQLAWRRFTSAPRRLSNGHLVWDGLEMDISARKRAEEALVASQQHQEQLLANSFDCTVLLDEQGTQLYVSGAVTEMLGYTPAELTGIRVIDTMLHPDDHAAVREALARVGRGEPVSVQYRHRHQQGGWVWLEARGRNLLANPAVRAIVATTRDITERKLAEEALRQSEEQYRGIYETAPLALVLWDRACRVTDWNRRAEEIFGWSREEILGRNFFEFLIPESARPTVEEVVALLLRGRLASTTRNENLTRDGRIILCEWNNAILRNARGEAIGVISMGLDITERRRAEEALQQSEQRFRAIFDTSFQFVGLLTPAGVLIEANDSALHFAGVRRDEVIGQPFWETRWWRGAPDRVQRLQQAIARCAQGEFVRYEVELQGAGATHAIVDFSLKPVVDGEGRVTMLVPEARDLTEWKQAEALVQRTHKLESLGVLAGGIAHDFNNLLGGLFGYVDLAAATTREATTATYLARVQGCIERARGLTRQLLTFAKGGAPVPRLERLSPFIEDTTRFALSGSAVSCRFAIPADLWPCEFDRSQIGQVIDNLVINAQQAMPEGGVLEVRAENLTLTEQAKVALPPGPYVRLSFRDGGIGIPREHLPKIFDPFFTTKPQGQGLGLATGYSILKRHGGAIEAESEPGRGSTFFLYLPARPGAALASRPDPQRDHRGAGTFLVMDDEKIIRELLGQMLEAFGYTVVLRANGQEAVAFFTEECTRRRPVAGMIFDLTIPGGVGGREAITEIRKLCPRTPVFVSSGYAEDPVMATPTRHGFTASLCKPFTITQLAQLLEAHLPSHRP